MSKKTILVTGASSGIGQALARRLAVEGHTVIALARDDKRLAATRTHPNIVTVVFDLLDTAAIEALAERLAAEFPALSVLVNNAAVQHDVRLDSSDFASGLATDEITLNLVAPILLTRYLLAHLARQPEALIVNVASVLALAPKSSAAVYSASKAGLVNFGAGLRNQLAGTAVVVTDVFPPVVDTAMTAGRSTKKISPEEAAEVIARGISRRRQSVWIGRTRLLPVLMRVAPSLVRRMMRLS